MYQDWEGDPHPPSRHCECESCIEDFAEKDKSPADGLIYQSTSVPEWSETNAQMALVMGLNGTPEQKKEAAAFLGVHLNTNTSKG